MSLVAQSFRWTRNPDGTLSGSYPAGDKPPEGVALTWNISQSLITAGIGDIDVGTAFSHDVRQYLSGTESATATLTLILVSGDDPVPAGWTAPAAGDNLVYDSVAIGSGSFRIRATGGTGAADSEIISWVCTNPVTVPGQTTGNAAVAVSSSQINQTWSATSGATSYKAKRDGAVIEAGITGLSKSHTSLTASTSYSFTVVPTNSAGDGTESAAAVAVTQAAGGAFNPSYPRLSSQTLGSAPWDTTAEFNAKVAHLVKHHVVTIDPWRTWSFSGQNRATMPAYLKSFNPSLLVFHHSNQTEVRQPPGTDAALIALHNKINAETGPNGNPTWWLYTGAGAHVIEFGTNWETNNTDRVAVDANGFRYPQWYARYHDAASTDTGDWVEPGRGLKEGAWDGVMADSQFLDHNRRSADYDEDGVSETATNATTTTWVGNGFRAYKDAWKTLHPTWYFGGNLASQTHSASSILNDVYEMGQIERLNATEKWGGWTTVMTAYRKGMAAALSPKIIEFHADLSVSIVDFPTITSEYRWNRYWLASTLMDNGYYQVTNTAGYTSNFWADEFYGGSTVNTKGYLGYPTQSPQTTAFQLGVYLREFDNGCAIVNPGGNGTRTITLPSAGVGKHWTRLTGTQDSTANSGATVTSITIPAQDGLILLRVNG